MGDDTQVSLSAKGARFAAHACWLAQVEPEPLERVLTAASLGKLGTHRRHISLARLASIGLMSALTIGTPADLGAQLAPAQQRFWLSGGAGVGALGEVGAGFVVSAAYQRQAHLVVLHSAAVLAGYELSHIAGEIGLLYGRASTGRSAAQGSVAIGLSVVQVDIAGNELRNTVGLPLAAEASVNAPGVGIGLRGVANLNTARSYAGLTVILRLGRLLQ